MATRDTVLKVTRCDRDTGRLDLGYGFDRGYQSSVCTISSDKNGVGAGGR